MSAIQACSDDNDLKGENYGNTKTLYKIWLLTDYSSDESDIYWQSNELVYWGEYYYFDQKSEKLYWNSRLNGENTTYTLGKIKSISVGSTFSATRVGDSEEKITFTIKKISDKHLLLYNSHDELYRSFVSSDYFGY